MAEKVGILPYLGSLAFLEFRTPYVVKTVPMEEEPNFDLTRMVHSSDIVGVWPKGRKNQSADDQGGFRTSCENINWTRQGCQVRVDEDIDFMGRGWVCYPSRSCDYVTRRDKGPQGLVFHP